MRTNLILLLALFFSHCKENRQYLSGDGNRTWLELDTSGYGHVNLKNGFVMMENHYGIFISSVSGLEKIRQPDLYDASPRWITKCLFKWNVKDKMLTFNHNDYQVIYKILVLNNDTLKLENNKEVTIYIREPH